MLALVFIFSGFVKAVDPWGTALNMSNYFTSYHADFMQPYVMPFSIWMCGAELMMGLMLIFKVRIRLISIFSVLTMIFFTVLTYLSLGIIPIEDCGCFGHAIHLSAKETFIKNLVLLPMSIIVWYRYLPDRIFAFSRLELLLTCIFCFLAMGLGTYSYFHLPPIDFLPFGVGKNIAQEISLAKKVSQEQEVVLIYRNRRTGKLREFSLKDKAWQNEKKWEWVDTRIKDDAEELIEPMPAEFYISDSSGRECTDEIINTKGRLYMVILTKYSEIPSKCKEKLEKFIYKALSESSRVIILTSEDLSMPEYDFLMGVEMYNMDAKMLITLLRARYGVVTVDDGTIIEKINCNDIVF